MTLSDPVSISSVSRWVRPPTVTGILTNGTLYMYLNGRQTNFFVSERRLSLG